MSTSASVMQRTGFADTRMVACQLEFDLGVRQQTKSLANLQRKGDLSFASDPRDASGPTQFSIGAFSAWSTTSISTVPRRRSIRSPSFPSPSLNLAKTVFSISSGAP